MYISGAVFLDEDQYAKKKAEKEFYNKVDSNWDYYSGLPNPKAYED